MVGEDLLQSMRKITNFPHSDDTCVAILGKKPSIGDVPYLPANGPAAKLFFNEKITSNNTGYGGIIHLFHSSRIIPICLL